MRKGLKIKWILKWEHNWKLNDFEMRTDLKIEWFLKRERIWKLNDFEDSNRFEFEQSKNENEFENEQFWKLWTRFFKKTGLFLTND
jgi:hypothetical protein